MNINYDRISRKIRMLVGDIPLYRFCENTGIHAGNLGDFLNGKRKRNISLNTLYAISKKCNVPLDYFFTDDIIEAERLTDYELLEFYSIKVSAGTGEIVENEQKTLMPVSRNLLQRLGYNAEDLLVLQVSGDSMEPTLKDGDFVFMLSPHITMPFVPRIYVVRDANNGIKVKRLDTDKYGNLVVQSDNPKYKDIVYTKEEVDNGLITIIGAVVGKITTA